VVTHKEAALNISAAHDPESYIYSYRTAVSTETAGLKPVMKAARKKSPAPDSTHAKTMNPLRVFLHMFSAFTSVLVYLLHASR